MFEWLSGGSNQYMTGLDCMCHDLPWVVARVVGCLLVASMYAVIGLHWFLNQKSLAPGPAKKAFSRLVLIFTFCGICGYLFPIILLWWPAWRLYVFFLYTLFTISFLYVAALPKLEVIFRSADEGGLRYTEHTKKCERCHSTIEEVDDYCPRCGAHQEAA